jgi:hypothetical protein
LYFHKYIEEFLLFYIRFSKMMRALIDMITKKAVMESHESPFRKRKPKMMESEDSMTFQEWSMLAEKYAKIMYKLPFNVSDNERPVYDDNMSPREFVDNMFAGDHEAQHHGFLPPAYDAKPHGDVVDEEEMFEPNPLEMEVDEEVVASPEANPFHSAAHADMDAHEMGMVTKDPSSIKNIKDPSEAVQMAAISMRPAVIRYIENPCETAQMAAVEANGFLLSYLRHPTEEVKLAAVHQNADVIQYVKNPSKALMMAARAGGTLHWKDDSHIGESKQTSDLTNPERLREEFENFKRRAK